ncbi:MAG TPA: hypothetical protein VKA50_00450 [Gammaproteobacteria bacterium]|nr:hypothetical protein [Gammaproteobacteria bacterium]
MASGERQHSGYRLWGGARFFVQPARVPLFGALLALCLLWAAPSAAAQQTGTPPAKASADKSSATDSAAPKSPPPNVGTADLDEVRTLAEGGAASLALRLLDRAQPAAKTDSAGWMQWERERVQVYAATKDWAAMIKRLDNLPPGLPAEFVRWARTQQAQAYLAEGNAPAARRVLRRLIWTGDKPEAKWLAQWRHLIIRTYLEQGRSQDAYTALLRYQQDYGEATLADVMLRARILLGLGRPGDAARLLRSHAKTPEGAMLYRLARLRSGAVTAHDALRGALHQARAAQKKRAEEKGKKARKGHSPSDGQDDGAGQDPSALAAQQWAVVAEAAHQAGDRATRAYALEQVISASRDRPLPAGLFSFNGDSLWDAYTDYAVHLGNRAHFLIGDDDRWFAAAEKAQKETPVRARSLYALLMLHGQDSASRVRAARAYVSTLKPDAGDDALLTSLFLHSPRHFPKVGQVPLPVRYALVDIGLKHSDIELASRVMATINRPPKGTDAFMWQLRRARIFVYGGRPGRGAAVLRTLLKRPTPTDPQGTESLDKEQIEHLLQVIFDLQTLGENDTAIDLFKMALQRSDDIRLSREILYWMGDSRKAQKRYVDAARLYLKSAMYGDPQAMDPWAQTARYQAAGALAKAGLRHDARDLYRQLLAVTTDPARRAVLRHDMQQLWLGH